MAREVLQLGLFRNDRGHRGPLVATVADYLGRTALPVLAETDEPPAWRLEFHRQVKHIKLETGS